MPISIDYDRKDNVVYTKTEGMINLDDIITYFSSVAALNIKKGYRVFADYTDAILELSDEDIHQMAKGRMMIPDTNKKISIAIICKDDFKFSLGRICEAFLDKDKYNMMFFRSRKEALQWLGL
jgi:succinate dehydrogenase flavin-adding protein (antitoxin of CptAB toxin-antitoxin module)